MSETIDKLLHDWRDGSPAALDDLMPVVVDELRQLARRHLENEPSGHTLQPTALVNEVYLRLTAGRQGDLEDRTHFFAFASRLMRQILVDHARARRTAKRGGGAAKLPLDAAADVPGQQKVDLTTVLAVDAALKRLEALDPRQGRIVELRYFSGLTLAEISSALGISRATVERHWSVARRWLAREIRSSS